MFVRTAASPKTISGTEGYVTSREFLSSLPGTEMQNGGDFEKKVDIAPEN